MKLEERGAPVAASPHGGFCRARSIRTFCSTRSNSVASLVRFEPGYGGEMILKALEDSSRLLKKGDSFVELREELEFIDDYLDIEVIRFGRDKLKVVKELDPASLENRGPCHADPTGGGEFDQAWPGHLRLTEVRFICAAASTRAR